MKAFKTYLIKSKFTGATIDDCLRNLNSFSSWCEDEKLNIIKINYSDLLSYIKTLRKNDFSNNTINQKINSIRQFYKFKIQQGKIKTNPALNLNLKGKTKKKLFTPLKDYEMDNIYQYMLDYDPQNNRKSLFVIKRDAVLLGFIIYQCLSNKDLAILQTKDINLKQGTIYIPATKRSNERILQLNANQILPLINYLNDINEEQLFKGRMNDIIQAIFKKLKPKISMQQLRSSRIALWLKQHNIRQVQYYAGFKLLSSIEYYTEQQIDGLKKEVEKYFPLR